MLGQTGANTAGCRVDGLIWVPRNNGQMMNGSPLPSVEAKWSKVRGVRHPLALIFIKNIDDRTHVHGETGMGLYLPDITRPGTFAFDQRANPEVVNGPVAYAAFTFYKPSPDQELLTGSAHPGRLVVTRLDTIARVVSGTYEYTASRAATGTTVRVTEGRFDCKF